MAKKIIENNKQDDDLKLLEEVNDESFNNQFLENTPDISIKGRGKLKAVVKRTPHPQKYSFVLKYYIDFLYQ